MSTHGSLTESSVSYQPVTPDRKGREGKGREVSHPSILVSGSASEPSRHLPARPAPAMDDRFAEMVGGGW